jgi:hypothetical protein
MSAAAPVRYSAVRWKVEDFKGARADVFSSSLPGALKLMLLALIENMPECYPGIALLANRCSVERKTVMRAITRLERMGVLAVERAPGRSNRYVIQPVPSWRTGTKEGRVPSDDGTGTNQVLGLVPTLLQTSPTAPGHKAEEADPESSLKPTRARDVTSTRRMGPVPFEAPVLSTEYSQFPKGWRWSEATEGAAATQGVTAAELQEYVDYWTTHKWPIPVTDLDGELRRSVSNIRKRSERERFKASQRSLSALPGAATSELDTTGAATAFRPTEEHRQFVAKHLPTTDLEALARQYRAIENRGPSGKLLSTVDQARDFLYRLKCLKATGHFIAHGPLQRPAKAVAREQPTLAAQHEAQPQFKGALPHI